MRTLGFTGAATLLMLCAAIPAKAAEPLKPRAEVNGRYSNDRAILMTEFWLPVMQDEDSVLYGDLRMMGDNDDNREGNLGIGYREVTNLPALGDGVAGVHGWIDRRQTKRGSYFNQLTLGGEWLGEKMDVLANGYVPLSDGKEYDIPNADPQGPALVGTGIVVDTNGRIIEEPRHGLDLEFGWQLPLLQDHTDSVRAYAGAYYFNSAHTESITGFRARLAADITPDIQIGGRFQRDDERGSQAFLEATIRFPFGQKKSYRKNGLRARMDDSPERDIDIVTGSEVTDPGSRVPVINAVTGETQKVFHVDNTAAPGGNGSVEQPFDTLANAQAAAQEHAVIYVHTGDGTSAGQNQGVTLNKTGVQLIGAGVNFVYDEGRFKTANGARPLATLLIAAGGAPVISNVNANSDGVTVSAADVVVAGVTIDGATRDGVVISANNTAVESVTARNNTRHGLYALNVSNLNISQLSATGNDEDGVRLEASGAAGNLQNAVLSDVVATGNKNGIRFYAHDDATLSGVLVASTASANTRHGVIVYDDSTAGSVNVDLGGGHAGGAGLNILAANTLEDLAVDLDGGTLAARNNWWGDASGLYQAAPSGGRKPQIYYGAPLDDGLAGHWTLDSYSVSGTTVYDRSGFGNNGTMFGGMTAAGNAVGGMAREALTFDGVNDYIQIANESHFDYGASDFSLSAWVFIGTAPNPANGAFITKNITGACCDPQGYPGYEIGENFNTVNFRMEDTAAGINTKNTNNASSVPFENSWHLVTGTRVGSTAYLYIDGALVATNATLGAGYNTDNNSPVGLGARLYFAQSAFMSGHIDDARIYSRALSANEIMEIYRMNTASAVDSSGFLTAAP
ncbi:MAG: hypothetical protein DYH13_03385 [Alphaproteobacteria bacterium PRO2]|nr:hypothetical protein [Alphaproteobacteria bacterium PRO2]